MYAVESREYRRFVEDKNIGKHAAIRNERT